MSTMIKKTVLFGALAIALVACGKKEEGPAGASTGTTSLTGAAAKTLGSCNKLANVGKCTEYDMSKDSLGLNKSGCEATDGKWQATACPTEKTFANCATSESKIFYYSGTAPAGSLITMDEEFAKLDCDLMSGKVAITGKATPAEDPKPAASAAPAKKAAAPAKAGKK